MSAPALRVVTADGELLDGCPTCEEKDDVIAGLEETVRRLGSTITKLRRDREADAKNSDLWPTVQALYEFWKQECRHPRASLDVTDFEQAERFVRKHGEELCRRAIRGIAYDHWTSTRKNGSTKRHDTWEFIFRSNTNFMECVNRAPREDS